MAQTTRLASFGPVLIVSIVLVAYFVYYKCIYYKILVSIFNKKTKEILKKLTYGPNDASGIVWARSRHLRPPCRVLCVLKCIHYKILVKI